MLLVPRSYGSAATVSRTRPVHLPLWLHVTGVVGPSWIYMLLLLVVLLKSYDPQTDSRYPDQ